MRFFIKGFLEEKSRILKIRAKYRVFGQKQQPSFLDFRML